MDRKIAETMAACAKDFEKPLGQMLDALNDEPDESIRRELSEAILRLIWEMHEKVVLPIARLYPDLHPDDPEGFREALKRSGALPRDQ